MPKLNNAVFLLISVGLDCDAVAALVEAHAVIEGLVELSDVDFGVKWIGLNPQGDLAIGARGVAGANL